MTIVARASTILVTSPSGRLDDLRLSIQAETDEGQIVLIEIDEALLARQPRVEPDGDIVFVGIYLHTQHVVVAGRPAQTFNAADLDIDAALDRLLGDTRTDPRA
jgi:hypothetical protein